MMRTAPVAVQTERPGPWDGRYDSVGTVAVVGLGKIGLPLAARYAAAGWHVIGVDVLPRVVEAFGSGRSHLRDEPGVEDLLGEAHANGRLDATTDHADAARRSDVVVMIVPVMLTARQEPDYAWMDAATEAVGRGLHGGSLVIYETTLPVGDTRRRFGPLLERVSGRRVGVGADGFLVAFSPERVFSGRVLRDLAAYPKLVGGVDRASTERAIAFYGSVLEADVWDLGSSETAEFAKLAETTYRDVNIALANELAIYADEVGVDITDVIRGANSQPFSHIHQPGIGVGGHCIPVYPHFLLSRAPSMSLVRTSRTTNDGQVARAVDTIATVLGQLQDQEVLVLGLTYREGVNEMAYSRGPALVGALRERGARVLAFDPLLDAREVEAIGAAPYVWGERSRVRAIVTQTADPLWRTIDVTLFPDLLLLFDGRNSLRELVLRDGVSRIGIGTGWSGARPAGRS